jgi:hypothetical protein
MAQRAVPDQLPTRPDGARADLQCAISGPDNSPVFILTASRSGSTR